MINHEIARRGTEYVLARFGSYPPSIQNEIYNAYCAGAIDFASQSPIQYPTPQLGGQCHESSRPRYILESCESRRTRRTVNRC